MKKLIITISECYEVEEESVREHGRSFRFFGTATQTEPGFWPWSPRAVVFEYRFYATADGACYCFTEGTFFEDTSRAFREFLKTRAQTQEETKYISLMERAKRI